MTYYACIAIGMADYMPDQQHYITADNPREFATQIAQHVGDALDEFDEHCGGYYRHPFRMPRPGQDNWAQRVLIGKDRDLVLDIIGMTADEWHAQQDCDV